jgi:uncharacterized membrane protein YgdD (TMEM256/DUF423 family)
MNKKFLIAGALLAGLAVALGAFAAHGLKKIVDADAVAVFQTGVQYQMYHALALLAVGMLYEKYPNRWIHRAGLFFIGGIILFSGSLYLLTALKAANQPGLKAAGIVTPFGGVFFIAGWCLLLLGVSKKNGS